MWGCSSGHSHYQHGTPSASFVLAWCHAWSDGMQSLDRVCSPETFVPAEAPSYFYDASGSNITDAVCSYWLNYTANATTTRLNVVRSILLNRLTNSSTALSSALAGYLTALDSSAPEVYSFVVADTGVDPQVYPYLVRCCTDGYHHN